MGFFKSKLTQEEYAEWMRKASCSFDSISGATAEISFGPTQISLSDCDGNHKDFEAEEVPGRKNHGPIFIYGKAKQAVINYMKEKGYDFANVEKGEDFIVLVRLKKLFQT